MDQLHRILHRSIERDTHSSLLADILFFDLHPASAKIKFLLKPPIDVFLIFDRF